MAVSDHKERSRGQLSAFDDMFLSRNKSILREEVWPYISER